MHQNLHDDCLYVIGNGSLIGSVPGSSISEFVQFVDANVSSLMDAAISITDQLKKNLTWYELNSNKKVSYYTRNLQKNSRRGSGQLINEFSKKFCLGQLIELKK